MDHDIAIHKWTYLHPKWWINGGPFRAHHTNEKNQLFVNFLFGGRVWKKPRSITKYVLQFAFGNRALFASESSTIWNCELTFFLVEAGNPQNIKQDVPEFGAVKKTHSGSHNIS